MSEAYTLDDYVTDLRQITRETEAKTRSSRVSGLWRNA